MVLDVFYMGPIEHYQDFERMSTRLMFHSGNHFTQHCHQVDRFTFHLMLANEEGEEGRRVIYWLSVGRHVKGSTLTSSPF